MDKNAVKSFAIESRRQMIESVKYQASLIGITAEGISEPISKAEGMETYDYGAGTYTLFDEDIQKREDLVKEVKSKGFDNVVEEVAYTWFNRIIAIRYMEVNDYLPTRTRVLSSEIEGKIEPDIITEALDIDLNYTTEDKELILKLKDENKLDELFQFLFIKQCNKLNDILPGLFKKTDDYMELLLDISFIKDDGIIRQLLNNIHEEDFGNQVEIIGWLYQYYISEKKDEVINTINKSNIKKEDIPAATQLFTTEWVVKYMVDNSLGRYWIERNPYSTLENKLEYYLGEAEQNDETQRKLVEIRSEKLNIENLTFFDPCMGSGHILVYAFDVFFEIYKELGFNERDIPELILKNNLFGLDIDDRAYQLAYFAILMKSIKYDRKILKKDIIPHVYSIQESGNINDEVIEFIQKNDSSIVNDIIYLKEIFKSGKEFGSLIQVRTLDFNKIKNSLQNIVVKRKSTLLNLNIIEIIENDLMALINQAELLSSKYSAVVTNPPYMNKFEKTLKDFATKYYKDYSKDLFSMFIYRNFDFCSNYGYNALMTPFVWMFIKNYENLRNFIINNKSISSLIQLEYSAFSEATVPICTFVLYNFDENYNGTYLKLSEFTGGMEVQKEKVLQIVSGDKILNDKNKFITNTSIFDDIPGKPIAYWADENIINSFKIGKELNILANVKKGMDTGKNSKFLRYWFEVNFSDCGYNFKDKDSAKKSKYKWFPYNKGGDFRRWVGNRDFVVNWENDGFEIKNTKNSTIRNDQFYFKKSFGWSYVSSSIISFRYYPHGYLFDGGGCAVFSDSDYDNYILGFLNSSICQEILNITSPTLNYTVGTVAKLPLIINSDELDKINNLVENNLSLCKEDYDDYETSKDFLKHPFIKFKGTQQKLTSIFDIWSRYKSNNFNVLKENEINLNKLFSKIYNVETRYDIENKHVSIILADYSSDIKSFVSYAVGCMFGRYSLDNDGIQFAGGEFSINNYSKFVPDDDNIIPVLDTEYFKDDIVGRFVEFVKSCFGDEFLEENLDFIAGALKKKGKTSREIIRNYFLNDFFKDHVKMYKKCPIYWQFDSGKQNAFKCLIYMHRYNPNIVARVRTDYLHKTQKAIEQNLARCDNIIANSSNKSEITKATKDKSKYIKQLDEIRSYDEALGHMANQNIEIDLDDGVKVNYAKFQNIEITKEGEKTKKVNLLKKI